MFRVQIPEYAGANTEEAILKNLFELVFAIDEVISIGYREHVTLQQIKSFTTMDSNEEKLQKIIMESKISEAREEARRKAESIDRQKAEMRKLYNQNSMGGKRLLLRLWPRFPCTVIASASPSLSLRYSLYLITHWSLCGHSPGFLNPVLSFLPSFLPSPLHVFHLVAVLQGSHSPMPILFLCPRSPSFFFPYMHTHT